MLRVLHVSQPTEAGVARVVGDLVADQVAAGFDVVAACPPDGLLPGRARRLGATVLRWAAGRQPGPAVAAEAIALAALVARHRPDLVHLHSSKAGLAGRLAVRGRLPTVFQPHAWSFLAAPGPVRPACVAWERYATRWTHRVLYVSHREHAEGRRRGIRGSGVVVPNGVDVDQ